MTIYKTLRLFFVTTLLILLAGIALPARAATYTVSTCDFTSLTAAVALAVNDGDIIELDCTGTIVFTSGITIAFDITMYPINSNIVTFSGDPSCVLPCTLFTVSAGKTFTLSDVTLENGRGVSGGAIFNIGTFNGTDLTIRNNTAWTGGGIHNDGTLNLNSVLIEYNTTFGSVAEFGAGIYTVGTATLTDVLFQNNTAGSQGGAIYNDGILTITNTNFTDNDGSSGGAIDNEGTLTITNSNFTNNQSVNGGALYNRGIVSLSGTTFSGNEATDLLYYGGGAIYNLTTLTATNVTFDGNDANLDGGAIYAFTGATTTLIDTTFQNNTAGMLGQAIFNSGTMSSQNSDYINNTCVGAITDNGGNVSDVASVGCPPDPIVVAPPVVPAPVPQALAPVVLGCALDIADGVEVAGAPDNTYCRILMKNGGVVSYSGAIPSDLISLGVVLAVDVYRLEGGMSQNTFPDYARICLSGVGRYFYMDGRNAPRFSVEMPTEQVDGLTCAWIPAPGTVILTN